MKVFLWSESFICFPDCGICELYLIIVTDFCFRHQLNRKKNKVDELFRKPKVHIARLVGECLSRPDNSDDFKEEVDKTLSKSLGGGSMNVCKTKVITLEHQERIVQGLLINF